MAIKKEAVKTKAPLKFTKEQLLQSERFFNRKDILAALLTNDKEYSFEQAEQLIDDYMKGKVK